MQSRLKLQDAMIHLTCVLCQGYLVDATTISECLHSFCKTCIVRHLKRSNQCPICNRLIHKSKPLYNLRKDDRLQNIVYKCVPGLHKSEMKRRRSFYKSLPGSVPSSLEDGGEEDDSDGNATSTTRMIISADDDVSISLEYYHLTTTASTKVPSHRHIEDQSNKKSTSNVTNRLDHESLFNENMVKKRYLSCPAAVKISHLQKFVRTKFNLSLNNQVDIFHCDEILDPELTLIDVAYIYSWKKRSPLNLAYLIRVPVMCTQPKLSGRAVYSEQKKRKIESNQLRHNVIAANSRGGDNRLPSVCHKVNGSEDGKNCETSKTRGPPSDSRKKNVTEKRLLNDKTLMGPPTEYIPKRAKISPANSSATSKKSVIVKSVVAKSSVGSETVSKPTVPLNPKKSSVPEESTKPRKVEPPKGDTREAANCNSPKAGDEAKCRSQLPEEPPAKKIKITMSDQTKVGKTTESKRSKDSGSSLQGICSKLLLKNLNKSGGYSTKDKEPVVQSNAVSTHQETNGSDTTAKDDVPKKQEKKCTDKAAQNIANSSVSMKDDVKSKAESEKTSESNGVVIDDRGKEDRSYEKSDEKLSPQASKEQAPTTPLTVNTNGVDDEAGRCSDSGRGSDTSVCSSIDSDGPLLSPPISVESPPMLRIVTSPIPDEGIDVQCSDKDEPKNKAVKVDNRPSSESPKDEQKKKKKESHVESTSLNNCEARQKHDDVGPLDLTTKASVIRVDSTKESKKRQNQKHKNSIYSVKLSNGGRESPNMSLAYTHSAAASIPCPNKPLVVKITRKPLPVANNSRPYIPNTPMFYSRRPPGMLEIPAMHMPPVCYNQPHKNHHHKFKPSFK